MDAMFLKNLGVGRIRTPPLHNVDTYVTGDVNTHNNGMFRF